MTVKVQCPNPACGKTADVPEEHLGRAARCRHCGHRFTLPSAADADPAAALRTLEPRAKETVSSPPGPAARPAPAAARLPERVGRFVVRGRVGSGAFGTVYRAYDPHLDREVALKVPQPGTLDDPTALERFLREGRAAARFRHPHIVPVYDAGSDGHLCYIASAFIEGRTLARAIADGNLDCRKAAEIVRDLAEALAYAHRLGVVHRDVKPANVLLDRQGQAVLTDFGLAHRQDAATKLTQEGALLGTPAYLAPEEARGQHGDAHPASDQYSLGVLFYESLCGRTPFAGPPAVVLYNAIHQAPPPPRSVRPEVPAELERICLKAMAKRPEERYPGCQELADDLRRWLAGEPVQAPPVRPVAPVVPGTRGRPLLVVLAALAAACLVVGVVLGMWMIRSAAPRRHDLDPNPPPGPVAVTNTAPGRGTERAGEPVSSPPPDLPPEGRAIAPAIPPREAEAPPVIAEKPQPDRRAPHVLAPTEFKTAVVRAQVRVRALTNGGSHMLMLSGDELPGMLGKPQGGLRQNMEYVRLDQVDDYRKKHPGAKPAAVLLPVRMAVVVAGFPYREQLEEWRRALQFPTVAELVRDPKSVPQFLGLEVQRIEVGPGLAQGQWDPLPLETTFAPLQALSGYEVQPDAPALDPLLLDGLAMPRLPTLREDQYPAVEFQLKPVLDTLASLKKFERSRVFKPPTRLSTRGGLDIFKPRGGGVAPPNSTQADSGEPVIPEYCLVRFLDVGIAAGKTCKYRLRVKMAYPGTEGKDRDRSAPGAGWQELTSDWADVADPVRVPPELFYYAFDAKTQATMEEKAQMTEEEKAQLANLPVAGRNQLAFQIHRWLDTYSPPAPKPPAKVPASVPVGDWVIGERVLLGRGEYMGTVARTEVPFWLVGQRRFSLLDSSDPLDRTPNKVPVFLGLRQANGPWEPILVDFTGGELDHYRFAGTDEDTQKPKYKRMLDKAPTELIVMYPDGKLSVRNAENDVNDEDRKARSSAWRKRIHELKPKEKRPGADPFGGPS